MPPLEARGPLNRSRSNAVPAGATFLVVAAVCAGLALTAGYGYLTLSRLRIEYLQNRAHEIAAAVDAQARGPGRRNNPSFWQAVIGESFDGFGTQTALIAVVDASGKVLAGKGDLRPELLSLPVGTVQGDGVYVFDFPLVAPGQSHMGTVPMVAGWRLRIGIFTSAAEFIRRQALLQAVITAIAIGVLLLLTIYLVRMLRRFVVLQAREQSEHHLKSLGVMAATLAHEIRNPLGAMKGLTQLAQEDLPEGHKTQALMKTVVVEAERLERLVSDLLTFASFRRVEAREFDYVNLVADVRSELQSEVQGAGKCLELLPGPESLPIRSDKNGLRQVLLNVFLNGIESTQPGGRVTIKLGTQAGGRVVVTEVDDDGPGIGSRDPEELFEPFVTTKTKGNGLGLAVSRRILESLGGTITLANRQIGGARCRIQVPVAPQ